MKIAPTLEREIAHLSEEDFKKIFPNQYYKKYAAHHNIIQYQTNVFKETKYSNAPHLKKVESEPTFKKSVKVIKMDRFDEPEEVIAKNRIETKRMEKFVKEVKNNIKVGPTDTSSKIRTPLTGFANLPEGVVDRLKLIEDAQYEAELQLLRQKKRKERKYMNFVPRSRYNSISLSKIPQKREKSIVADSIESKSIDFKPYNNMSNTMLLHSAHAPNFYLSSNCDENHSMAYAQKVKQILNNTKSEILHQNPEEKHASVKCILAMNRSIKKMSDLKGQMTDKIKLQNLSNVKKTKTMSSVSQTQNNASPPKKKKNLIQLTENIRKQVHQIEMLSHYKQAQAQKQLQQHIQEIK